MGIIKLRPALVCAALVYAGALSANASTITYLVNVNTSSVSGTSGFLDFQFNPGNNTSVAATAQILNFNPDGGSLSGSPSNAGSVSGTLPGTVTLTNSTALNEMFQGFMYGSNFSFTLTLSGPAVGAPNVGSTAGTEFGLGLYDSGQNPILTNQGATTGFAATVDINTNGTTTVTTFPSGPGRNPVTTITQIATPEPSTLFVLGASLTALVVRRRLRK